MGDLRKAAEMALEALEYLYPDATTAGLGCVERMDALREALAQPDCEWFGLVSNDVTGIARDYTEAARRGVTVMLANGEEYDVHLVDAGVDGWLTPVIRAYDEHDEALIWGTDGDVYVGEADIVAVKREWVGLTDEDVRQAWKQSMGRLDSLAKALEAKLKEKNT